MWGGCWGRCGDADACVLFIFDLLTRAADQNPASVGGICFRDNLEKVFSPSNCWVRGVSQYMAIGFVGSINPSFGDHF